MSRVPSINRVLGYSEPRFLRLGSTRIPLVSYSEKSGRSEYKSVRDSSSTKKEIVKFFYFFLGLKHF